MRSEFKVKAERTRWILGQNPLASGAQSLGGKVCQNWWGVSGWVRVNGPGDQDQMQGQH